MAISYDVNSITPYPDGANRQKTLYVHEEGVKRLSVFWDKRFTSGTITSTWATEPTSSDWTVASATATGTSTQAFVTAPSDSEGREVLVKNKVVSSLGETDAVYFKVVCT